MTVRILTGHVLDVLPSLPESSVHCVICSPPYLNLRSYNTEPQTWPDGWVGELGAESNVDSYVSHLVDVFAAVRRVMRIDATLFVNLGDSFSNKNLNLVPQRFAIAMQRDGWIVRSVMPWLKRSCMPESVRDRPVSAVEDVILFTKSGSYFWDAESVKRTSTGHQPGWAGNHDGHKWPLETNNGRGASSLHTLPSARHYRTSDMFFDSLGPLLGAAGEPEPTPQPKRKPHPGTRGTQSWSGGSQPPGRHPQRDGPVGGDADAGPPFPPQGLILDEDGDPLALDVNPAGFAGAHFATFPPKLVRPLILAGTSEKGACAVCGSPWVRVVERERARVGASPVIDGRDTATGGNTAIASLAANLRTDPSRSGMGTPTSKTTGWLPSCRCQDPGPPVPCRVLDCFGGSGTTGKVAEDLGRDSILIDLNGDYVDMASDRITAAGPMFADVEVVK